LDPYKAVSFIVPTCIMNSVGDVDVFSVVSSSGEPGAVSEQSASVDDDQTQASECSQQ